MGLVKRPKQYLFHQQPGRFFSRPKLQVTNRNIPGTPQPLSEPSGVTKEKWNHIPPNLGPPTYNSKISSSSHPGVDGRLRAGCEERTVRGGALDGVLGSELSLTERQHLTTQPFICAPRGLGGGGPPGGEGGLEGHGRAECEQAPAAKR